MAGFWKKRLDDVVSNLTWLLVLSIFGGGLFAAISTAIKILRSSFEWKFVFVAFVISSLAIAVVLLIASRKRTSPQQPNIQPLANVVPTGTNTQSGVFDFDTVFRHSYISNVTNLTEQSFREGAKVHSPEDQVGLLAKFIGIGYTAYLHDMTWSTIYKSQLLMLLEMNRRAGYLSLLDAKPYFDKAVTEYPDIYSNYTYDQWVNYLIGERLVLSKPAGILEITVRGKDLLKYLTHWGRYPEARRG